MLSFFIGELSLTLQAPVRLLRPANLCEAYALAKLHNDVMIAQSNLKLNEIGRANNSVTYGSSPRNYTTGWNALPPNSSRYPLIRNLSRICRENRWTIGEQKSFAIGVWRNTWQGIVVLEGSNCY